MRHRAGRRVRRGFTVTDLVIVLCLFFLLGRAMWTIACRSRETAHRVRCATNLKQIGLAILNYSNANKGAYPRTTHDPTTVEGIY